MNDPGLNNLLKWGVENSAVSRNDPNAKTNPSTKFDPEVLRQVLTGAHGPSDAEMMCRSMKIITEPENTLEQKITAFDDFENLVENLDNANNLGNLKLWEPLLEQLQHEEADLRRYAAWCAGTAVENNAPAQERLLIQGGIPALVKLAMEDKDKNVRKKAVRAVSAASRNFQPGLDAVVDSVPSHYKPKDKLDAGDMDSVDSLIDQLRAHADRA